MKSISCCATAHSWWEASISKPISSRIRQISRRQLSPSIRGTHIKITGSIICNGGGMAVFIPIKKEEFTFRPNIECISHLGGFLQYSSEYTAGIALKRRSVRSYTRRRSIGRSFPFYAREGCRRYPDPDADTYRILQCAQSLQ